MMIKLLTRDVRFQYEDLEHSANPNPRFDLMSSDTVDRSIYK